MNLKCDHGFCGYEIEWSTARKPENEDMLGEHGCPECGGTLRAQLPPELRLAMFAHLLHSTMVPYGDSYVSTWDRWVEMRIPVRQMLGDVKPMSTPPMSEEEFDLARAVLIGRVLA